MRGNIYYLLTIAVQQLQTSLARKSLIYDGFDNYLDKYIDKWHDNLKINRILNKFYSKRNKEDFA